MYKQFTNADQPFIFSLIAKYFLVGFIKSIKYPDLFSKFRLHHINTVNLNYEPLIIHRL